MIVKRIILWFIGVRMRSNLKQTSEDPHYVEAKLSCIEFQEAKKLLFQVEIQVIEFKLQHQARPLTKQFQAFKKAELGVWVEKPMEQDEFEINSEN